jgi:hypothetical protein
MARGLRILCALFAGLAGFALLSGCGSKNQDPALTTETPTDVQEQSPEELLEATAIDWNGYTMHVILVTDDEEKTKTGAGPDIQGRLVKVCFAFDSSTEHPGGFEGPALLDELSEHPIKLAAKDGTTVEWRDSIGDIEITGDFSSGDLGLAEDQARFSIYFDIPLDRDIEDYELDTGSQRIPLIAMESPEYSKDDESAQD